MSAQLFHYFRADESAAGIVIVDGPPKSSTDPTPSQKFPIQRRIPVNLTADGIATDVVSQGFFVKCVVGRGFTFFMKLDDFKAHLGGASLKAVYQKDWDSAAEKDIPAFRGWFADGVEIGVNPTTGKGTAWPSRGIVAPVGVKDRYALQCHLWKEVATHTQKSTSSARLWKSKKPINPRWKIFFAPTDGWLSVPALQSTLDALTQKEQTTNKNMNLTSWLNFSAISFNDATAQEAQGKLVRISKNLLGFYVTFMPVGDLKKMIQAQTAGRKPVDGWMRALPTKELATAFDKLVAKPKSKTEFFESTLTTLKPGRPDKEPVDAASLMGGQSANEWAKKTLWTGEDEQQLAEWLHRSAHSLGSMTVGNEKSQSNVVFGSYEANSDVTRTETMIRLVMDSTDAAFGRKNGAGGTLQTRIVNSGDITYINSSGATGKLTLDTWLADKKFSWLAPILKYKGKFNYERMKVILQRQGVVFAGSAPMWDTEFATFSCYTPLTIEGKLDRLLWNSYFKINFPGIKPSKKSGSSSDVKHGHKKTQNAEDLPESTAAFGVHPSAVLATAKITETLQKLSLNAATTDVVATKSRVFNGPTPHAGLSVASEAGLASNLSPVINGTVVNPPPQSNGEPLVNGVSVVKDAVTTGSPAAIAHGLSVSGENPSSPLINGNGTPADKGAPALPVPPPAPTPVPPKPDAPTSSPSVIASQAHQTSREGNRARHRRIMQHPTHIKAWQAASQKKKELKLDGITVINPRVASKLEKTPSKGDQGEGDTDSTEPPADEKPPVNPPTDGFVLSGSIKLFGLEKLANLMSWHGPPPSNVQIGSDLPVYQHIEIDSIYASDFIPLLVGTPFEKYEFTDVTFTYQNYNFEPIKPLGFSMTANIAINEQFGTVYKIFNNVLHASSDALNLRVSAALGLGLSWDELPTLSTFVVEGVLDLTGGIQPSVPYEGLTLGNGVNLSRVGLRLTGVRSMTFGLGGKTSMNYGFAVFGDMHVTIPACKNPLQFDFEISEIANAVQLNASLNGDIWTNAFGLGLDLESVALVASLDLNTPVDSLAFDVQADLTADTTSATFTGSYTPHGDYSLKASVSDFGVDGILNLFRHYTGGGELSVPAHMEDIHIGNASISISSEGGLEIEIDTLTFDNYTSSNAKLTVTSTGVTVEGSISDVKFPEVDSIILRAASIRASFEKTDSKRSTDVALAGQVEVKGLSVPQITAAVHLYKSADSDKIDWTVYGEFTELGDTPTFGSLIGKLKGTFLENIALSDLAFVAASKDDPLLSSMNPQKYPITKGVKICAVLSEMTPFRQLLRRDTPGLTLSAGYSTDKDLTLDISLPADTMIHLGRGITTDPITLSVGLSPIQLNIRAGMKVPVPHSSDPLDFSAVLALIKDNVSVTGQMHGLWNSPFGISKSVSVGPDLALEIGINLPEFFLSGIPSTLGFAGQLAIGETSGKAAVQVSEDPTQELLSGELDHFGIEDVVAFTRQVTGLKIPSSPNFLSFKKISYYMSTGVTIGTLSYPDGFSFEADLSVFGTDVKAAASITVSSLLVKGSVSAINVGPLQIQGHDGKDAILDLELGDTTQKMTVDGMIKFLGSEVALFLDLEILPTPQFQFDFLLRFTDLLLFQVDAAMIGSVDLNNLKDLDFSLHALFEQHLLEFIKEKVVDALEQTKKRSTEELEKAKKEIEVEKAKLTDSISKAQAALEAKREDWLLCQKTVHDKSDSVIQNYLAEFKRLQDDVDSERQKYDLALKAAENQVQLANAERADKMRDAEANVTKTKNDWDSKFAQKEKDLENAKNDFSAKFGHAEQDVDNAKAKVDTLQNQINDIQHTIDEYGDAHWYELWKKAAIPGLLVEKGAVVAAKAIADGFLTACKAVLLGFDYGQAKALIPALEAALAEVQKLADAALDDANLLLQGVDKATSEVLVLAQKGLEEIQKGGDAAFRAAEAALDDFVKIQKPIMEAAQTAIDDLIKSVEWVAYQAATGALDLAQHATNGLDAATKALTLVEKGEEGILDIAVEVITAALSAFDIQKVELEGTMRGLLGQDGKHFTATVEGLFAGKPFKADKVELNLAKADDFIHSILVQLIRKLASSK